MIERDLSAVRGVTRDQAGALTDRPAHALAQVYGYPNLEGLINDLPHGANVLDAGSGCSNLGEAVSLERDDVTWVNLDVRYAPDCEWAQPEGMLRRYLRIHELDGPPNLLLVGESVDHLPELFPEGHFNRTFSYYMLPHIFMGVSNEAGERAIRYMLQATAADSKASFGPLRWIRPGIIGPPEDGLEKLLECHDGGSSQWEGTVTAMVPANRELIPGLAKLVTDHVRQ